MVNWSDPAEIAKDSDAFQKTVFALFGLYLWELFITSEFEWSLLTGSRRFRWPLVFFFLTLYCLLFSFIGLIISWSITTPVNCGALFTFNSWTGNMAILCASTSLMLRTIALWERKLSVVIPLGIICLAHWTLLYRTMFIVRADWDDDSMTCVVTSASPSLLNVTFFFTIAFDFVILCYTAVAPVAKHSARTGLWKLLFKDGLVYFLLTFSMNCVPAVLNLRNLNTPMNVIATVPAATVSSIAACRAVMRLLDFNCGDLYVHSISISTNPVRHSNIPLGNPMVPKYNSTRPEVHVTTEHITMAEFPPSPSDIMTPVSPYTESVGDIDLEYGRDGEEKTSSSSETVV